MVDLRKVLTDMAAAIVDHPEQVSVTETEENEPVTIIYQTTEDDADDTVVPRFNSAGGNGENLIFIKEDEKSLSFGDNRIREAIEMYHAKLLILDPMSSYIGENCSMNNANETRAEFNHLIAVAKDTGCAIVIIAHMNKMKDTNPLYRTNGSIDIAGAVRSIIAITRTPNKEVPAERYLVQVKSNLAPTGSAILFEVSEKGVDFISEMEMTAEEAFQSLAPKIGRPNDKEIKAKEFLSLVRSDAEKAPAVFQNISPVLNLDLKLPEARRIFQYSVDVRPYCVAPGSAVPVAEPCFILLGPASGIFDHRQSVILTKIVRNLAHFVVGCFLVVIPFAVRKRHAVETEVVMDLAGIRMSGNDNLKSVAPQLLCQLDTDLMCDVGRDLACRKRLIPMKAYDTARLLPSILGGAELLSSRGGSIGTIDTGNIELLLGFHGVGIILQYPLHRVELCRFRILSVPCLCRVRNIAQDLSNTALDTPDCRDRHQLSCAKACVNSRSIRCKEATASRSIGSSTKPWLCCLAAI